jgi:hypothetical protein
MLKALYRELKKGRLPNLLSLTFTCRAVGDNEAWKQHALANEVRQAIAELLVLATYCAIDRRMFVQCIGHGRANTPGLDVLQIEKLRPWLRAYISWPTKEDDEQVCRHPLLSSASFFISIISLTWTHLYCAPLQEDASDAEDDDGFDGEGDDFGDFGDGLDSDTESEDGDDAWSDDDAFSEEDIDDHGSLWDLLSDLDDDDEDGEGEDSEVEGEGEVYEVIEVEEEDIDEDEDEDEEEDGEDD